MADTHSDTSIARCVSPSSTHFRDNCDLSDRHWPDRITDEQLARHGHLRIVGLVGSIDNDMSMTDLTIGAPTAMHRICEAIDNIHSTAISHSRAFVLEVMGRHCGWLSLMGGVRFVYHRPPRENVNLTRFAKLWRRLHLHPRTSAHCRSLGGRNVWDYSAGTTSRVNGLAPNN